MSRMTGAGGDRRHVLDAEFFQAARGDDVAPRPAVAIEAARDA